MSCSFFPATMWAFCFSNSSFCAFNNSFSNCFLSFWVCSRQMSNLRIVSSFSFTFSMLCSYFCMACFFNIFSLKRIVWCFCFIKRRINRKRKRYHFKELFDRTKNRKYPNRRHRTRRRIKRTNRQLKETDLRLQ